MHVRRLRLFADSDISQRLSLSIRLAGETRRALTTRPRVLRALVRVLTDLVLEAKSFDELTVTK